MNGAMGGLFRKEWIQMKWLVVWIVLLNVLVVVAGPFIARGMFDMTGSLAEHAHITGGTWFYIYTAAGVGILFSSLEREMKTPGIWLHSPLSMFMLAGAKVVFATTTAIITLCFGGLLHAVLLLILGEGMSAPELLALFSVLLAVSLKIVFYTCTAFFLWVVYWIFHQRVRFIAIPATFMLFALVAVGWEKLRVSGFFDWLRSIIPIKLTDVPFYNEQTGYFFTALVRDGVMFSVGSLLFYAGLSLLLVAAGSRLFEKKVRL